MKEVHLHTMQMNGTIRGLWRHVNRNDDDRFDTCCNRGLVLCPEIPIIRCMVSFDKIISQSVSLSPVINQLLVNLRASICVGLFS